MTTPGYTAYARLDQSNISLFNTVETVMNVEYLENLYTACKQAMKDHEVAGHLLNNAESNNLMQL